jgi:hypothetical protein
VVVTVCRARIVLDTAGTRKITRAESPPLRTKVLILLDYYPVGWPRGLMLATRFR